jgi:hypothetical protein
MGGMSANEQKVIDAVNHLIQKDQEVNYFDDSREIELGGVIFYAGDYDGGYYPGVAIKIVDSEELLGCLGEDATEQEISDFLRGCKEDAAMEFENQLKDEIGSDEYDRWCDSNFYPTVDD